MKKAISLILILILLFGYFTVSADEITLYNEKGETIRINSKEKEKYLSDGWYSTRDEVIRTLYALDGRTLKIYLAELDTYLKLGWYSGYDEVVKKLYTPEGRVLKIYKAEEETYMKLGWMNYEDATATLYASGGKSIVVFKNEVETYLALGWHKKPLPDPSKPMVAFTFDDGPHPAHTRSVIDTLKSNNSTATFFVLGKKAKDYPDIIKYAVENGMEIGNHSYNHANLANLSASAVKNDVASASQYIYEAAGEYPKYLRTPYGSYNNTIKYNAKLPVILWSVDTRDWESRNAHSVYNHILEHIKDGDIILMHDIYPSTAEAVKMVVPELIKRGYQIVSVSDLAEAKGKEITKENKYFHFR